MRLNLEISSYTKVRAAFNSFFAVWRNIIVEQARFNTQELALEESVDTFIQNHIFTLQPRIVNTAHSKTCSFTSSPVHRLSSKSKQTSCLQNNQKYWQLRQDPVYLPQLWYYNQSRRHRRRMKKRLLLARMACLYASSATPLPILGKQRPLRCYR